MAAMTSPVPASCGIAFKEWAGVCEALAQGRQSLILRKGGISEGPGGFRPEHAVFWLYPTHVHEGQQGLKADAPEAPEFNGDRVAIRLLAVVESVTAIDRPEVLPHLAPLHVWTEETVYKRFHYRRPGLWALSVRVYSRQECAWISISPEHAGCKTWVPLEPPIEASGVLPVLDEGESARRRSALSAALTAAP
jgi:hypothetical protein